MATKKKASSKKGNMRDVPKATKKLTDEQAKTVNGGKHGTSPVEFLKYS